MVAHIVLFTPKANLPDDVRSRLVESFTTALRDIPGIRHARVGRRVRTGRPYEQLMQVDYQYAAILEFDDEAQLKAYLTHDAHETLGAAFFEAFDVALMYDFDLKEGDAAVGDLASTLRRP